MKKDMRVPVGKWRPIPDPTVLTAQAVDRAKADLRSELAAQRLLLEERLHGMERLVEKLSIYSDDNPQRSERLRERIEETLRAENRTLQAHLLSELARVRDVHERQFEAIGIRFGERDARFAHDAAASKSAVSNALAAAKEAAMALQAANDKAIDKSEKAVQSALTSLETLMRSGFAANDERVSDMKSRLDRGDGQGSGSQTSKQEAHQERLEYRALLFSSLAAIVSVGSFVLYLVAKMHP